MLGTRTPHMIIKYDDTGSIGSEYNEPADDNAIDMGDVGMNTHVDINSGRLDDGVEVEAPENS